MTGPITWEGDAGVHLSGVQWVALGTSDPDQTRDRWTEVEINRLESGAFVIFIAGLSERVGENARHTILYCPTPEDLVRALLRPMRSGGKHLPDYAQMALADAAGKDATVGAALRSWESASSWAR